MPKKRFKSKSLIFVLVPLIPVLLIALHEVSVRHFQDVTCVVCHEMKDPIKRWKESGTAVNHNNCAGCHYDASFDGWMKMNKSAVTQLVEHFRRDPDEPLKPPEEPLFLEEGREPGYWSMVPNHRCFQCKDAKNHQQIDQPRIHSKLIKGISQQPCKDCHNHEMRKGQKFYEQVLPQAANSAQSG